MRRSGPRTVRMNRARWMADRARMFKKPMQVAATDLKVAAAGSAVRVRFTQAWASGTYKDVGPKELLLVAEAGGWRIAREELLSSRVETAPSTGVASAAFALVVSLDRPYVLLHGAPEEAWRAGALRELDKAGAGRTVRAPAALKQLPPALAAWRGRKLRVHGDTACDATVGELFVIGRVTPHFGTEQEWRGIDGGPPLPPAEVAREIWTLTAGEGQMLAGALEVPAGCKAPRWARDATLPAPAADVPFGEEKDGELQKAALAAFRKLPAWAEIQRAYKEDPPDGKRARRWDEHDNGPSVLVARAGKATLVAVLAQAGAGCGGFEGSLGALFQLEGDQLVLRSDDLTDPQRAIDSDGDGQLEVLFGPAGARDEQGLYLPRGRRHERRVLSSMPYLDCAC